MSKTWAVRSLLLALLVAVLLRLPTLGRKSLWLDEVVTLQLASDPIVEIITPSSDPHPPLYYLGMHYWLPLGESDFFVRLPSAVAGIAAVLLLYWVVRLWHDDYAGVVSAWLLAVSPLHIWYSQEVRMYAWVCTFSLASTLFYSLALRHRRHGVWLPWMIITLLGLYTHYSMLLIVFLQFVFLIPLWREYRQGVKALPFVVVAWGGVAYLFAPQARLFWRQLVVGAPDKVWHYAALKYLLSSLGFQPVVSSFHLFFLRFSLIVAFFTFGLAWFVPRWLKRVQTNTRITVVAIVGYILTLTLYWVPRGWGLKRQLLVFLPYGLALVAWVISERQWKLQRSALLVVVALPLAISASFVQEFEAWEGVSEHLLAQEESGDVILVNAAYARISLEHYYDGELDVYGVGPEQVPLELVEMVEPYERVWLVLNHENYTDPNSLVQEWLDDCCLQLASPAFRRVQLILYDLP